MSAVGLGFAQTRYSLRGFLRDPRALVISVIMPVFLVLILNTIFRGKTEFDGVRVPVGSYYTASISAYVVMMTGFGSLLLSITAARERGLLKRFRGSPMPAWVYLFSQVLQVVVIVIATVVVLISVGIAFYGVHLSGPVILDLVVYVVVGTTAFSALGLAVTALCATTEAASALGPFSTVVLSFVSGVFVPVALMPRWLVELGKFFPLEHLAHGLQAAFLLKSGISSVDVIVLGAWGVAGVIAALGLFRWEPSN